MISISEKNFFKKDYYISIYDNTEGCELYNTQDILFTNILKNLPYSINFTLYTTNDVKFLPITLFIKEGENDIGTIDLTIDNEKPYYEISDSFNLKSKKPEPAFFIKLKVENVNENL